MKKLLLFLLWPAFACAQEVTPIISNDYLLLIRKDSLQVNHFRHDTMNNRYPLLVNWKYVGYQTGRLSVRDGVLNIESFSPKVLHVSGAFNSRLELKRINRIPALQSQYVQGRSQNGNLLWRGPETNELFSYGPALSSLEYDGSLYAYDENGQLVPAGTGNGKPAQAYNNSIFRTASLLSQSLRLQGQYRTSDTRTWTGTVKLGHTTENTFIRYNKNTSRNISGSLEARFKNTSITGGYTFLSDQFSNSNRNGFLNRVYQNALLSPVSFSNAQNAHIASPQAYSNEADNPLYLLTDNGNRYVQTHQSGSLILERKFKPFKYKFTQSVEHTYQQSREGLKPGSAFFPAGITIDRRKKDVNYLLEGNASYDIRLSGFFNSVAAVHYSYTDNHTAIGYSLPANYRYQRSAHDVAVSYAANYQSNAIYAGVTLANKMYASNTTSADNFWLPNAAAYVRWENLPDIYIKLSGTYNRFNNELPVGRSFSQNSLLQYNTQQAFQYFPVMEVSGIDNLEAVRHTEWSGRLEISHQYNTITLYGELFNRKTVNDIFPVMENGQLVLRNIAGHRNRGMELGLMTIYNFQDLRLENSLSFFTNRSKVTDVKDGYDHTPLAGFSNIHTAIVKGAPLGSIVGTSYQRDASNNILIGADGFPLVNTLPVVIGNPIPDFTMKLNNTLSWRKWNLDVYWEWKKGGQLWNGTQAVLDYYGRSAASAAGRNITDYVFTGVLQDKGPNDIPVAFYDVNKPVEQNRWTRYGHSGIGEEYIQPADVLRINNISIGFNQRIRKYIQQLKFSVFASNLILYSAYKGADPNQLLYDQPNTTGLDFFNLPSIKSFGCNISIQF